MNIWLSIAFRVGYLALVAFFALGLAIPVGMGFDHGAHFWSISFAAAYLLTFLPALGMGFAPSSVILHPPSAIKVWYWWIALLGGSFALYQLVSFASVLNMFVGEIGKPPTSADVCFTVSPPARNAAAYIDLGSPDIEFERFGNDPLGAQPLCRRFHNSLSPMKIRAYSAVPENRLKTHAEATDNTSNVLAVDLRSSEKICVVISPINNDGPVAWSAHVVPCAGQL